MKSSLGDVLPGSTSAVPDCSAAKNRENLPDAPV
jgi:hypothetical protein